MSTKITYQDKIELLDHYIAKPRGMRDAQILRSIKTDVVRCTVPGTKKASQLDTELYNKCMGIYRAFLKSRGSHLDLQGRKAKDYKEAMIGLISWIRTMQLNSKKPSDDDSVSKGLKYIFDHWDRLNEFHQARLGLPDIYKSIEEIIPMIKNGTQKATKGKGQQSAIPGTDFGKL